MNANQYLAAIDHALAHNFIVTRLLPLDDCEDGNKFFPHLEPGTILTVEAVICTDFGLEVRVSFSGDGVAEFDIELLATHCDLHSPKNLVVSSFRA